MKKNTVRLSLVATGLLAAGCNRTQPQCSDTQYFHTTLRACVGRMCEPGANPMHPDCFDGGSNDASDSGVSSGTETGSDATDATDATRDVNITVDDGLVPPRQIAPLSTSIVSSRRPTLRWQLSPSSDSAVVEFSRSRDFSRPMLALRAEGEHARPPSQLAAGVWFWRVRARASARNAEGSAASPVWLFRVGVRSADSDRDTAWGNELDVNGDGYSDTAVASIRGDGSRGRVDVYFGSASGIAAAPSATIRSAASGTEFGARVASAGDVNGDGFGDLIVSAPSSSNSSGLSGAGSVYVFLGGDRGLTTTAATVLEGQSASARFGEAIHGAGDVNSDGRADIVVGAPLASPAGRTAAGSVFVYGGNATGVEATAIQVIEGDTAGARSGDTLAGGGDINGDGVSDFAVGASAAEVMGRSQAGSVSVFHGSATGPAQIASRIVSGATAGDNFGCAASMSGDVNGDGLSDLLVGACSASPSGITNAGQALLFLGSPTGLSATHAATFGGADVGDRFASTVQLASDVNADGFSDLVVGAARAGMADVGALFVFHGAAIGVSTTPSTSITSVGLSGHLPSALACPGDVNGDGFSDVVAGDSDAAPSGRNSSGAAIVLRGSATGLESVPARTLEGAAPLDSFGNSVASIGLVRSLAPISDARLSPLRCERPSRARLVRAH